MESAKGRTFERLDNKAARYLEIVRSSASRMEALIGDLLAFMQPGLRFSSSSRLNGVTIKVFHGNNILKYFQCLLGTGLAACVAAQDISGTIDGVVLDPSGAGVPGARVTVTNVDRNQVVRTLATDVGGNYASPLIPIGNYELKAEAAGFKTGRRTGIVLNVNDDLKINITLEVGAVTESVEVREAAANVELGMATGATTTEGTQMRETVAGYPQLRAACSIDARRDR